MENDRHPSMPYHAHYAFATAQAYPIMIDAQTVLNLHDTIRSRGTDIHAGMSANSAGQRYLWVKRIVLLRL
jgi:hypothetical protein